MHLAKQMPGLQQACVVLTGVYSQSRQLAQNGSWCLKGLGIIFVKTLFKWKEQILVDIPPSVEIQILARYVSLK